LDGRKSDKKAKDFYDLAAEKFNDVNYVAVSEAIPDLHSDFKEEVVYPKRKGKVKSVCAKFVVLYN